MKHFPILIAGMLLLTCCSVREQQVTYCNPIDIDYSYMVYNSEHDLSYRSGADPAVVDFRGEYYMFVTRSHGYWHSKDLTHWHFVTPRSIWYPQGCNAPTARNYKDSVLYVAGDPSGSMSVLWSDDPASGVWHAEPGILHDLQDPDLFIDDDGSAWMFWGSSNVYPIRGKRLDRERRFLVVGETFPVIQTDSARHGWERFGDNHSDTRIAAYIEGPWMTKHNGRYYMQYAAPGTEFNVYGDGVYVADSITGPYTYQAHNPVTYKPGGFMNGAGHGSTVLGPGNQYWHYATMSLSATVNWERRICAYPLFFDEQGLMYANCEYGDWPHYAPSEKDRHGAFTGWMLLSYGKPVTASSYQPGGAREAAGFAAWNKPKISPDFLPRNVTDENCKTYWLADTNTDREWLCVDLETPCTVHAVQINFHDHYSEFYTRTEGLQHRFVLEGSLDGQRWSVLEDRSRKAPDAPNAYVPLRKPARVRYVRYRNVQAPTPNLAISGLRVFGTGEGEKPERVEGFHAHRCADRRNAELHWQPVPEAVGYQIRWGIAPDKLYLSWLVYGDSCALTLRCLDVDTDYYFDIEAFNENGIGPRTTPDALRVMSYNIRLGIADDGLNSWENRRHATLTMLRREQPAVWGVQEAYDFQLRYITDSLPYRAIGVGRDDGSSEGEHMAILFDTARVHLLQWGTYWLSETPDTPSLGWDAACRRTATWALLRERTDGRCFYFVNTHLDHVGRQARANGLRLVMDSIARMNPDGYPMVLTGDFNVLPTDPCLKETARRMRNARYTADVSDARPSFNGWGTEAEEIDYIWYRGFEGADRFRVLSQPYDSVPFISDHYPVTADLRWKDRTLQPKDTLRVLAIGNSFSDDATEQYLTDLAEADGVVLIIGNMYIPGCTLERHAGNIACASADYRYTKHVGGSVTNTPDYTLQMALADERWDIVTLQQASGFSGLYDSYHPFIDSLLAFVRTSCRPDCDIRFHQTWAYQQDAHHDHFPFYNSSQQQMYQAIMTTQRQVMRDCGLRHVIPSGTAVQNARATAMGDHMTRDGYHMHLLWGRYTVACTWYEALTGRSVLGNRFAPEDLTLEQVRCTRLSAHKANRQPWKLTLPS